MQIFSIGDNLHEMSNPVVFGENKKNMNLPSAELAQSGKKLSPDMGKTLSF